MLKDLGIAQPDARGWVPVDQAMLATGRWCPDAPLRAITADPIMVEGVTTSGKIVDAFYFADGLYNDRWCDPSGSIEYRLTHVRPLR